jgi:hypothetical protein
LITQHQFIGTTGLQAEAVLGKSITDLWVKQRHEKVVHLRKRGTEMPKMT